MNQRNSQSATRRLRLPLIAMLACIALNAAGAQTWGPERAIEIVAGSAAGGAQDRTARAMQQIWKDHNTLKAITSVVNKPGGGGAVSHAYLSQRAGDAHYIVVSSPSLLIGHIMGTGSTNYTDLTPLAVLFSEYIVIAVNADSPIKTAADLAQRLKADPASVSAAVATARGGMQHVAVGLMAKAAGADVRKMRVVIFNSGGESVTAVMGGHVDIVATAAANAAPQVMNGKLRIIGVAAPRRLEGALASAPTLREQGYDVVVSNWRSVLGPKGLSAPQIAYWDAALGSLVRAPEWNDDLKKNDWVSNYMDSAASRAFFASQYETLRGVLADLLAK
ncbi:MAG: tripartite tricarboxylate transporter substrate binding protein [Betaproteobacteria bacterium]